MIGSVFHHIPIGSEGKNIIVRIVISNKEWGIIIEIFHSSNKTN